jgi:cysteine desulfurase
MRIYLDHNATTPVRDEVVAVMLDALRRLYGNPSSVHAEGAAARAAIERARGQVASLLGVGPRAVMFTSGASEANNMVLFGAPGEGTWVASTADHPSVEAPLASLEARGRRVVRVPVDSEGLLDPEVVDAALADGASLLSLILANNETGVLQPVAELAARAQARGVAVHLDATQAVGKLPLDFGDGAIDWVTLTAHKFGGPKGAGCLISPRGGELPALLQGGPQEGRRRGGTENVPGIVGLGAACALAERELDPRVREYGALRDRLWQGIEEKVPHVHRNGSRVHVLPNTLNVTFEGVAGELLLQALDLEGIAVSAGAACASGSIEPSRVLLALGLTPEQARGTLRFSVGHGNDESQIDRVVTLLPELVTRIREARIG